MTAGPHVYSAINAVTAELAKKGIPKAHTDPAGQYQYRSIDDVLAGLCGLLARHRLCVLARALKRTEVERQGAGGEPLRSVTVRVAYALTSAKDGSSHTVETFGEALDEGDKATAKALSAAFKTAMTQTFCIPACGSDEPETSSRRLRTQTHMAEPVQGWAQWAQDIGDILSVCESEEAVDLVQERNRDFLKALGREQPTLYAELGKSFISRRKTIGKRRQDSHGATPVIRPQKRTRGSSSPVPEVANG